jgi:hypothetical protein
MYRLFEVAGRSSAESVVVLPYRTGLFESLNTAGGCECGSGRKRAFKRS